MEQLNEKELKAEAYDLIAQIQFCQSKLNAINAELERRALEQQKEPKKEK